MFFDARSVSGFGVSSNQYNAKIVKNGQRIEDCLIFRTISALPLPFQPHVWLAWLCPWQTSFIKLAFKLEIYSIYIWELLVK